MKFVKNSKETACLQNGEISLAMLGGIISGTLQFFLNGADLISRVVGNDFWYIGVFPKWSRAVIKFSEFSEFVNSDKSLKHELGSI